MKSATNQALIKGIIHWSLAIVTALYLISGFGITQFRIVETLTFGLLSKNIAFKIHDVLWIPFIVLVGLHVLFVLVLKPRLKSARQRSRDTLD